MRAKESKVDGSYAFESLSRLPWCLFWSVRSDASSQTNEQTVRIFASLWSFSVDLTFSCAAPQLVDYVQYLHVIGQTILDDLGDIKILARTCPVWTAHMATLTQTSIY